MLIIMFYWLYNTVHLQERYRNSLPMHLFWILIVTNLFFVVSFSIVL